MTALDPARARHIDDLLALVRDGRAPPVFVYPARDAAEGAAVRDYIRGRKGCGAFIVEVTLGR